jgi:hypothetical protein
MEESRLHREVVGRRRALTIFRLGLLLLPLPEPFALNAPSSSVTSTCFYSKVEAYFVCVLNKVDFPDARPCAP